MNKEFVWTDELLKQFADRANYCGYHRREYFHEKELSDFKASHTPEVKRDWEILKGGFRPDITHTWEESCHNVGCDIFSVRRISDNSIWTVGDVCLHGPIVRFNLRNNEITADFEYGDVGCSKLLSELSKPIQRTPLPPNSSERTRIQWLEDRVAYIEKILKIEG